jgi:hypothetical protein
MLVNMQQCEKLPVLVVQKILTVCHFCTCDVKNCLHFCFMLLQ